MPPAALPGAIRRDNLPSPGRVFACTPFLIKQVSRVPSSRSSGCATDDRNAIYVQHQDHKHMESHYDVIVIGAGPQGLAAAKTYLQLAPTTNLLILDSLKTLGGVWAQENIYPGMKSNNLLGTLEFTDFPMRPPEDSFGGVLKEGQQHVPGGAVYEYLRAYAEEFGLLQHLKCNMKVLGVEHLSEGGWRLRVRDLLHGGEEANIITTTCEKLIVATGLTARPQPISIPGAAHAFKKPLMTFSEFRHRAQAILDDDGVRRVGVLGGSKSAFDAIYLLATHGKEVTWIIRASGHGPAYMAPAHIYLGPFKCWLEKLTTMRVLTWFSPCVWGHADGFGGIRGWLHGTRVGRWVVRSFWGKLTGDIVAQTHLLSKGEEVKKLCPHEGMMWYGNGISILNYESDFHSLVQEGKVKVVRKDVQCLESENGVRLADGTKEDVDALVCSTGWQWTSGMEFSPKEEHAKLGVPSVDYSNSQKEQWDKMEAKADVEILERFPMLAEGPSLEKDARIVPRADDEKLPEKEKVEPKHQKLEEFTPWRLFRGIAPPDNPYRDIVFLGMMMSLQTFMRDEIVSLWGYAYLNMKLSPERMTSLSVPMNDKSGGRHQIADTESSWLYDTALFSRFGRWRYPMGFGARFPDFIFDGIPYVDLLMRDLGLRRWRTRRGWFGEVFRGGYGPSDYVGLVDEWRRKLA